jgi:NADH:ubiquinone oxidoreductase subunit 5 (subunit L)/multisubunit Na+/H+ antiporter MnhA subunit
MMTDQWLFLPVLFCASAALIAALFGIPSFNRRLSMAKLSWSLSLAPLAALIFMLSRLDAVNGGLALSLQYDWMPSLGLRASLYLDSLSALFALLVTGIGTLVVIYTGYYFKGDREAWRFLSYLLLFMTAMLGLVLAGDLITFFVFWEATSVASFLLIAYKYENETARRSAFKSLFITGGGGVALLAGLLIIYAVTGNADFAAILGSGDLLRQHTWYQAVFLLVAIGALTKSAQAPAHIWLPDAMSAPTPASAYLHSATMVKAGIYLLARLHPVLGQTDLWFGVLSFFGLTTMLIGAYMGLKQNDLKSLLAYSTVGQLGVLVMMLGQETEMAFKALVIGIVAHALYKCALFLVAGIVDHETGTRDLQRLGGLARMMPIAFAIAGAAAFSMAGLPPLFGFLAKEAKLATVTHSLLPEIFNIIFPVAAVIAGAFIFAQAFMFFVDTFLGKSRDPMLSAHEAPKGMLLMPAIPAALSFVIGLLPEPEALVSFLANAATIAYGSKVKVSLALWTGITPPLILSLVAVTTGIVLFAFRQQVRTAQVRLTGQLTFNVLYSGVLRFIDHAAYLTTRTQGGLLRRYLMVMLIGTAGLIIFFGKLPLPFTLPTLELRDGLTFLRAFTLLLAVAASAVTIMLRGDFLAILALGAAGLAVALLMLLEPAPDVALVQVVVDILMVVILILALLRLPPAQREQASAFTYKQSRFGLWRDGLIATASAVVIAALSLSMLMTKPRESVVTPFYENNAKPRTGASDIVGAIVIDFRGFDTLIEITVFAMAGIGILTLLRFASRQDGEKETGNEVKTPATRQSAPTLGIAGPRTSLFVHLVAYAALPLSLVIAITHIMYGHDQPGDGFTAGVIISLAAGFWHVVFGYHETKRRLPWLKSMLLIGAGISLAMVSASLSALLTGSFFAPVDFGKMLGLTLPKGFSLSTSFLFEAAICATVLGSAVFMLETLARPQDNGINEANKSEESVEWQALNER